jgi:glycosyltransferase involved in cell wall biosynthesis
VYTAIGLPERLTQLRTERMRRLYARALASSAAILAYSDREAEELRSYLSDHGEATDVEFVPFGVDEGAFRPANAPPSVDVVMAGADPHRDVDLFVHLAAEMPARSFHLVTSAERARTLGSTPANLQVEVDVPLEVVRSRLEGARVVALPVLENTYSGATTVLTQAMALGKAVVVTRTQAIATGYGLSDGDNCRLVEPGDVPGFGRAVAAVLRDEWHARALGSRARRTVESGLTWGRYVDRIETTLLDASEGRPDVRSPRD